MSSFAENLRAIRKSRGLNQDQLAELLGVAKSTVSMYERGNRRPRLDQVAHMAQVLGVQVSDLMRTEESSAEAVPQDDELAEYLEMLRTRPECRMLMSTLKNATKQQIVANVAFIESLRGSDDD